MSTDTTARDLGEDYVPLDPAHTADPHAFYARARREAPVFFSPAINAWVVSRYEDVVAVVMDHRRFAQAIARAGLERSPGVKAARDKPLFAKSLGSVDPPKHTRLRGSVSRALSARRIAQVEPRIRALTDELIDQFEPRGQADFMARFAHPFPVIVIGSLFDLPEADFRLIQQWGDDISALVGGRLSPDDQARCAQSIVALQGYALDLAERRRQEPRDDLASDLITSVDAGQAQLSSDEVAAMLQVLLLGAIPNTRRFLGNCLHRLLAEYRHWQAIVDDPGRIPALVEEALRMDGPTLTSFRTTTEEVELGGKTIPKGALVQVLWASANRDESVFTDPETFDPGRARSVGHLQFGHGVHYCVGAPLARLEMRIALEQLSARMPSLHLVQGQPVTYTGNLFARGPEQLLVAWDDRAGR
jgi:cytochrome P450